MENLVFPYNSNYGVTFTESGLPSGKTWTACIPPSSCKSASAGSEISFTGLSGENSWSVEDVADIDECGIDEYYEPSPSSGTVISSATIAVTYTLHTTGSPFICLGPASGDPATDGAGIVGTSNLTPPPASALVAASWTRSGDSAG